MFGLCIVLSIFAGLKWRQERNGLNRPRVLRNYGPPALGLTAFAIIILIRIVTHATS
jgi:hypothetical protein